jgi:proteasome alpha subunit
VALLIGGIENGRPRLYETDPSGTPYEWKAVSIGADRGDLQEFLEEHYRDDMDLDAGISLALRAIASTSEDGLEPEGVDLATIDAETERFSQLSNEDIAAHLDEHEFAEDEETED